MPDSGLTQSETSLRITTPIVSPQTNTSTPHSEVKSPEVATKNLPTPDTLEAYKVVKQQPFAFEHFGIETLNNMPTYKKWADIIDNYVQSEITEKSYKDSLETYKEIIDQVSLSLGLDEKVVGAVRIRRVAQWIRDIVLPMKRMELRKKRILHAT